MSCEVLLGTWKSDKEISIEYNFKYFEPTEEQQEFYNQVLGNMKLTYTETTIKEHFVPTIKIKVKNKTLDFGIEESEYSYEVISCNEGTVKVKFLDPLGEDKISEIHFENENLYWISFGDPEVFREYFARVE